MSQATVMPLSVAEKRRLRNETRKAHYEARLQRARERRAKREADVAASPPKRDGRHYNNGSGLPVGVQAAGFWLIAETPEQVAENNALLKQRLQEVREAGGYTHKPYRMTKAVDDVRLLRRLRREDKDLSDAALEYDPAMCQDLSREQEWLEMEQERQLGESADDELP
jgi:hypothetical protein